MADGGSGLRGKLPLRDEWLCAVLNVMLSGRVAVAAAVVAGLIPCGALKAVAYDQPQAHKEPHCVVECSSADLECAVCRKFCPQLVDGEIFSHGDKYAIAYATMLSAIDINPGWTIEAVKRIVYEVDPDLRDVLDAVASSLPQ